MLTPREVGHEVYAGQLMDIRTTSDHDSGLYYAM